MTLDELKQNLASLGWHVEERHVLAKDGYAWRSTRDDGIPDCTSNEKPPCICVNFHKSEWGGVYRESVEVELCGEVKGERWHKLTCYGLPMNDDVMRNIDAAIAELKAAWTVLGGHR